MKLETNMTEAASPVQPVTLADLHVECVQCDAEGLPLRRRVVPALALFTSRRVAWRRAD